MAETDELTKQAEIPFARRLLDWVTAAFLILGLLHNTGVGITGNGFSFGVDSDLTVWHHIGNQLDENSFLKFVLVVAIVFLVVGVPLPVEFRGRVPLT